FSYGKILENENLKKLIEERKHILEENRILDLVIKDKKNICAELLWSVNQAQKNKEAYSHHYGYTLSQKPEEPSILLNIFTLGFCQLYYPAYLKKWEEAFSLVNKEYNLLEEEVQNRNNVYNEVKQQLSEDKNRQKYIEKRLESIDTEVKEILSKLNYGNIFESKFDLLKQLSNTSRTVLETSIQEELLNPENFINSLNNLGISIQQGLNLSVEEPPQENEATKNVI